MPARIHERLIESKIIAELTDSRPQSCLEIATALNQDHAPFKVVRLVEGLRKAGILRLVTSDGYHQYPGAYYCLASSNHR